MAGYLDFSDINPCEAVYIEFDSDKVWRLVCMDQICWYTHLIKF